MASLQNNSVLNYLNSTLNLDNVDSIPTSVADKIQPVIEVNPKQYPVINIVKEGLVGGANGQTKTIYTTPTTTDFYLTSFTLGLAGTSENGYITLSAQINGTITKIIDILFLNDATLIINQLFNFSAPILIDANTPITFALANTDTNTFSGIIMGFTSDNKVYNL